MIFPCSLSSPIDKSEYTPSITSATGVRELQIYIPAFPPGDRQKNRGKEICRTEQKRMESNSTDPN